MTLLNAYYFCIFIHLQKYNNKDILYISYILQNTKNEFV